MELVDLENIKQIINEMIKTKKSYDKAVGVMGKTDIYGCSRVRITTMNANISKRFNVLEDYKPHLIKAVNKL